MDRTIIADNGSMVSQEDQRMSIVHKSSTKNYNTKECSCGVLGSVDWTIGWGGHYTRGKPQSLVRGAWSEPGHTLQLETV